MIILGIDPGLSNTGYGIIRADGNSLTYLSSGTISSNSKSPSPQRLSNIFTFLDELIKEYQPSIFSIENTFVNANPVSALKLREARGVAIAAAGVNHLDVFEYSPNQIKKAISGYGHANKEQIINMVQMLIPKADIKKHDEADALAIALCHYYMAGNNNYLGTAKL